jgi:hypothetical protein
MLSSPLDSTQGSMLWVSCYALGLISSNLKVAFNSFHVHQKKLALKSCILIPLKCKKTTLTKTFHFAHH